MTFIDIPENEPLPLPAIPTGCIYSQTIEFFNDTTYTEGSRRDLSVYSSVRVVVREFADSADAVLDSIAPLSNATATLITASGGAYPHIVSIQVATGVSATLKPGEYRFWVLGVLSGLPDILCRGVIPVERVL